METKGSKSENVHKPQTERKHPPEYEADLSPDRMAGQNVGERAAEREQGWRSAYDHKRVHRTLADRFEDDELKKIPLVPTGTRLQQGATYLDLADQRPSEFTAQGDQSATDEHLYVAKDRVPYSLWNRLRGEDDPERTLEG